ncbi:MAG TPA: prepilin-type N-terminal cleavage/methylation domain-containing protein [Candidatus Saccharimonadales bacterium]
MNKRGFTLIEVLLSVGVITLIAGITIPVYLAYANRNDLTEIQYAAASGLRRAATYSRAMNSDSQWGVAVANNAMTLFKGDSYSGRDTTYDESTPLPSTITVSGLTEIIFAKRTGLPNIIGTITLHSNAVNESKQITINGKGVVSYE